MKKENDIKISVIVPIYKVEMHLRECVDSIINQTYKNLEIILVDDGSPDNCPKICDEYAQKDNRVIVINKRNGGLPSARNAGLKIATGDFVHFVDSDDKVDLKCYEICVQEIFKNPQVIEVLFFRTRDTNLLGEKIDKTIKIDSIIDLYEMRLGRAVWLRLYRRDKIKTNFDENIRYLEDHVFNVFFKIDNVDNHKIICIPKIFYFYRQNNSSIMNTFKEYYIHDLLHVKNLILKNYKKLHLKDNEEQYFLNHLYKTFMHNTLMIANSDYSKKKKKLFIKSLLKSDEFNYLYSLIKKKTLKQKILILIIKLNFFGILLKLREKQLDEINNERNN